jgi:hypothetical protein
MLSSAFCSETSFITALTLGGNPNVASIQKGKNHIIWIFIYLDRRRDSEKFWKISIADNPNHHIRAEDLLD